MADWKKFLLLGMAAALALPLADRFGWRDAVLFPVVALGMLGMARAIRRLRPEPLGPWLWYFGFVAAQWLGSLIQANTDTSGEFGAGLTLADFFLVFGHVSMVVALWQLASLQHREFPRHGCFQGWVLAASLVLVGWQFLFLPTIVAHGFALDEPQTLRMLSPTLAFVEIGMVLWLWTSSAGYRSGPFALLALATVSFGAGEALFHGTTFSLGVPHVFNLVLWMVGYVCYITAVLHPEMRQLSMPRRGEEGRHAKNVLALLLPMVLLLPVALLVTYFRDLHPATIGILAGFFLLMLLGWHQLRMSIQNITQSHRLLEEQSRTDYLTGVPNRSYLEDVARKSAYRSGKQNGLLLIDIDGFKSINNMFGFHKGDLIIQAIADRFHAASVRNGHYFARVDGDEFALLLLNVESRREIEAQAWQLHRLLDEPIVVHGVPVHVTCSVGMAIGHAFDKANFAALMRDSERALGWARERQSQVEVYDKDKDVAEDKSWVLAEFRGAVATHQLLVYYQPKIHVRSRKVMGVEALIRWHHPERGVVMPYEFMQKIETTDLAHQLFTLVLHDAAKQWHVWSAQGVVIGIALNVVARDIMSFDLVGEIEGVLVAHQMPSHYLEIEITESSALSDPAHVKTVLAGLMRLGVKISIDDYGTGYSSLLYLQQWPLHFLKIDQQFIQQMRNHPSSATIVRSTMELARNLNVEVVAEGVEDAWVFHKLTSLGCYGVQGFLFSQAVAADHVVRVVREIESVPIVVGDGEA